MTSFDKPIHVGMTAREYEEAVKMDGKTAPSERKPWTPGPWVAHTRSISGEPLGGSDQAKACAVTRRLKQGEKLKPPFVVAEGLYAANARLIAAAPELYEALDALLRDYLGWNSATDALAVQARAALSKATGGTDAG